MTPRSAPDGPTLPRPMGADEVDAYTAPRFLRGWGLTLWRHHLALLRGAMIVCMIALTASIATEVVTRYFFGFSIFAIEDFAKFAAVYMYFIGSAHSVWQKEVVSSSMIEHFLPPGIALRIGTHLRHIATLAILLCFLVWSWDYVAFAFGRRTMSVELGIHLYWFYAVIPVSLALSIIYHLIQYLEWMRPARSDPS